jgi:hypothetical protein
MVFPVDRGVAHSGMYDVKRDVVAYPGHGG